MWIATGSAMAAAQPVSGGGGPSRLLDVPYVTQSADLCGGAAVAMVLRYWGARQTFAEDFAPLVDRSAAGIRTDVLAAEVRRRGWRVRDLAGGDAVGSEVALGRPVIALVRVSPDRFHYVVVVAWTRDHVVLHDPARAPFRVLSRADFDDAWAAARRWAVTITLAAPSAEPLAAEPATEPVLAGAPETPVAAATPCDALVAAMVTRARAGDPAGAEPGLRAAAALCPRAASVWRELAGVQFLQERWDDASAAARRAADLEPADAPGWDLLATSLYLDGRPDAALDAWNHIGRPIVDLVRVDGARRTRHPIITAVADLPPRAPLTAARLGLARRRLADLPAAASTRVSYRPIANGLAEVDVAVAERAPLPRHWVPITLGAARAALHREAGVAIASPTGSGEVVTASLRWWERRPRVALALVTPSPAGLPGNISVDIAWERQTYRVAAPDDPGRTEQWTRRRGGVRMGDWLTPWLRWEAGLAIDTWRGRRHGAVSLALDTRAAGDRLAIIAEAGGWSPRGVTRGFAVAGTRASWRSSTDTTRSSWQIESGASVAGTAAPPDLWAGAGTGFGRAPLLRAHPLLDDGVVDGVFGRRLVHASAEWQRPVGHRALSMVQAALFVDAARAWRGAGPAVPLQVDAGAGLRIALPRGGGRARVDLARGLRGGGTVFSASWRPPWPGR